MSINVINTIYIYKLSKNGILIEYIVEARTLKNIKLNKCKKSIFLKVKTFYLFIYLLYIYIHI